MLYDKILKYANHFEKAAAFDFDSIVSGYKGAIQRELDTAIRNIKKSISSNAATIPQSFKSIDEAYGKLANIISTITPTSASFAVAEMKQIIGGAKFYTSPQNTGTGFDPKTKEGGAYSPASYLKRIENYVTKLDSYAKYYDGLKLSPKAQQKAKPKEVTPALPQLPAPEPALEVAETLPQLPPTGIFT